MVSVFGNYIEFNDGKYWCKLCLKTFTSLAAIHSHCRNTSRHGWCEPCKRVFASESDKDQHLTDSPNHHICFACDDNPDFEDEDQLDEHLKKCHFWCSVCDRCHDTEDELRDHLIMDHQCGDIYPGLFDNQTSLYHDKKRPEEKNLKCPCCERVFSRFSFLLLHLERGGCSSIESLKAIAFYSHHSYDFTATFSDPIPYLCVDCKKAFFCLSGLYQHVEDTEDCSSLLNVGGSLDSLAKYIISELENY